MKRPGHSGIAPAGHCPRCGYDQRGLSPGTKCPECGVVFWPGDAIGRINRWADRVILRLWYVCILLVVGLASWGVAVLVFVRSTAAAVMLGTVVTVYLLVAALSYGFMLVSTLRRRSGFDFLNLMPQRRARLQRWLLVDGLLLLVALLAFMDARG